MAHVFIVDEKTLQMHLKYKFAGTGAKEFTCDFLNDNSVEIKPTIERLLCGMIADISRIRKGDNVIFYLQQTSEHEGMFFGSMKIAEEPFLCMDKFLETKLKKNLTFRVLLEPDKIYSKGITERECLDSLEGIKHPSELCWSLIYRKLKGNRGCTMITDKEYEQIMKKIEKKNSNRYVIADGYDYDSNKNEIVSCGGSERYTGTKEKLNIIDRLIYKKEKGNAYEAHLQAYVLQNLENIKGLKPQNIPITWIGNEVSCGVGMQSIDVCFYQENNRELHIVICELKDEQPTENIKNQINKYISWIVEYIAPTYKKKIKIYPTIIAPLPKEKTIEMFNKIKNNEIKTPRNIVINRIRYIPFVSNQSDLLFKEEL